MQRPPVRLSLTPLEPHSHRKPRLTIERVNPAWLLSMVVSVGAGGHLIESSAPLRDHCGAGREDGFKGGTRFMGDLGRYRNQVDAYHPQKGMG